MREDSVSLEMVASVSIVLVKEVMRMAVGKLSLVQLAINIAAIGCALDRTFASLSNAEFLRYWGKSSSVCRKYVKLGLRK